MLLGGVFQATGNASPAAVPVTTFQPQTQWCTLTLTVDAAGRVTDLARDGSRQACAPLTDKLTSP